MPYECAIVRLAPEWSGGSKELRVPPIPFEQISPFAMAIADVTRRTGIGRTTIFGLIRDGRLPAVKLGSRTLIRVADLEILLASLPPARNDRTA
jgi:excisionase family DNA binding protein